MASQFKTIINSRKDLDAIVGTPQHEEFMAALKGTMLRKQDVQIYPDGYNQTGYNGPVLEPIWQEVEDLSTIERFGFSKSDFE